MVFHPCCRSRQGIGAHISVYSFCSSKKSKAPSGDATPRVGSWVFLLTGEVSLLVLLPPFVSLKDTGGTVPNHRLQWCRSRPAAASISLHVQKKVSKETRPPFVHNCLRQSRIPLRHKINPRRKKFLSLRQFFFIFQFNFNLFGGTQRQESNQDKRQKHVNKLSHRSLICCSQVMERIQRDSN